MKLRIEKAVYGGAGLARADGKVVFVPYTLPGELVEVEPARESRSFSEAMLLSLLEPAAARAQPPCPYFGVCGGCHYQHASYPEQLSMKVAILRETLERAKIKSFPEITPVSADPLGYRNRIRLHIDRTTSALCYKQRASHRNLQVTECPIAAPLLERALQQCMALSERLRLGEHFEEIEFFVNHDESELLLSLWATGEHGNLETQLSRVAETLQESIPQLSGAAAFASRPPRTKSRRGAAPPDDDSVPAGQPIARWAAASLTYHAAGELYRVSFGSFFQGNRLLLDDLVALATSGASGRLAWDLYAGVGLFSRVLARAFEQVIAVEGAGPSSSDLQQNLRGAGHRAVQSGVLEFLRRPVRERPDFLLVDPPRAGLGPEITSLLSRIGPPRITYVSCDPATLSRDLAALVDSGYRIRKLHMVDLFPQTYHLETVAQLSLD
jgi:23S rRNA (uracil1939-C5)-methyltransferase